MAKKKNSKKDKKAAKKAAVLGKEPKSGSFLAGGIILGVLVIIVVLLFVDFGGEKSAVKPEATVISKDTTSGTPANSNPDTASTGGSTAVAGLPTYEVSDNRISYPVAMFDDGQAKYYEYPTDGGTVIRYFILKSFDGVVRAAFDACDVCWQAGRGYEQSGDVMICLNCGRRFESDRINEVKGGCNPAPLERRIEDGKLIIDTDDLLAGRQYFNFGGRNG